jgi:outer membrane receptor protein involved in Fe transport
MRWSHHPHVLEVKGEEDMKIRNTFLVPILFLFISMTMFAQTGKLSGRVTDLETGEPLIGANIIIGGTNLGAATNINGEYIILNIPPNAYSITAKYIGYQDLTQSNIRISVNVTTQLDFALPSSTYELDIVEIVARKPLINKNVTNTISIVSSEDIENLPVRGVNAVVGTQAGVVTQGGNLFIRGSRADQVAFYVDGVLVNDPVFGGATTMGIQNAVQEIQFQAGGYPAEYGGANAGIITTTTKIGGERFRFSFEGITDNFGAVDVGDKFLGTYTTGYNEYVLTASGPLLSRNLRFFIAGSNVFRRTPAGFHRGMNYENVYDPGASAASRDTFNIIYPEGYRLNRGANEYQAQGNISLDLNPFTIKLSGSYMFGESREGVGYLNFRNADRAGLRNDQTITGSVKLTHVLGNKAFYDLIFNYFNDYQVRMDPILKHNITAYGDSAVNAAYGTTLLADGEFQRNLRAYNINFRRGTIPFDLYEKSRFENMGGQLNLLYQIGQHHEVKTGADFKRYTIRYYALAPVDIASQRRFIPEPQTPYDHYNRLNNYGYDVNGNPTESGLEAPRHPIFAAYYIQDKIEYSDLVINAGLRLDYIDIDGKEFENPNSVVFDSQDQINPEYLKDTKPVTQVSPRLGFSFPVTDRTVFHAQYGKFIQQSRLRDVYQGYNVIADNIKGGFAIQNPVGFGLRPERTTQYEIGFKQQLGESFAFDVTGFYKDIKDQIQIRPIYAAEGARHNQYYAFVNNDFSTVKGVELKFDLRRTERIAATIDYTFSDALGTGSNPSSSFRQIWQSPTATPFYPQQIAPLDFNQAHTGFLNIDYRFTENDGPSVLGSQIFSNMGANFLFSFKSGFNYTRWDDESFGNRRFPTEALNTSTTPWTYQVDFRIDKTFKIGPLEPNIYLWVINLLNTQNVLSVFNVSGDPYDDGYLTSREGLQQVENIRRFYGDEKAEQFSSLYTALNYDFNNFGPPRQIRLGIRLGY